jgi:serine/threonine-protein kinase RsbW
MKPLVLPGTLESLTAIAQYVKIAIYQANLDKKAAYQLRLAVDEIATNIVIHGYEAAGIEGELHCQAFLSKEAITIFLEDTGLPFDPTKYKIPDDLECPLEQRQIGGLGIYLAHQGVDKLAYERIGNRNRCIIIVNRL